MLVLMSATFSAHASPDDLPFRGVVLNPLNTEVAAFAVRANPPTATATNYTLGLFSCAVFPGTTLYATDERQIANGEVWYSVQVESSPAPARPSQCAVGATGWMVGELKAGASVVRITTRRAPPPPPALAVTEAKREVKTSGEEKPHTLWWYYLFLVAGTVIAMVLLTWERYREVALAPLVKRLTMVEIVVVAAANVIILALVIPLYCTIETKSSTALLLQQSTLRPDGHFVLGFILTVLLLKSVSFAKESKG